MHESPKIIGFTGQKNSGKNAAADFAAEVLQGHTMLEAFADPIKEYAYDLDPLIFMHGHEPIFLGAAVDEMGWEKAKEVYPQVRRTLQRLGTEVFRKHVSPEYWIEHMDKRINHALNNSHNVIVTDIRFPDEARIVRAWGGTVIRIDRPGLPDDGPAKHVSETGIRDIPVDWVILNDGSLDDLRYRTKHALLVHGLVR